MRYELPQDEEPALTDRAQALLTQVEKALPNILDITNRINAVLSNTANLTSNLNVVAGNVRPIVSNLNVITANLRDPKGSLGEWIIPTNINRKARRHAGHHAQDRGRCRHEPYRRGREPDAFTQQPGQHHQQPQ